ncbi:GNAT family N-acetyltransferase [Streptomyces sp. JUS-F4]|uniref:GNAT family N-acetyltransferase n=1 Tax=Streptomyces sp. JUS-F4 TaxID=2951988 RepID=UPI002665F568|nr:GNAT family N-acetyltransferase [Streptomyces sp. JUS-F4]WKN15627.1 GNAT family N-acetyltransferase [Streptomyces sp. JUS-F4]
MKDLVIRAGRPDELGSVESLLSEASAWLASRGIDQWQYPPHRDRITEALDRGVCFLAFKDGKPVATIQVDDFADPDFWTPEDRPDAALYVHRMAVTRTASGADIGGLLLDWASERAAAQGKRWLRLDAWKDNQGLHRFYKGAGFTLLRIVNLPSRRSGALFQRSIESVAHKGS